MPQQAQRPPTPPQATVDTEITCRQCRYLLRGLHLESRCPECGLAVWDTIIDLIDPASSHLPRLRDPIGVGNALLWLMGCALAAVLLVIARPVAMQLDRFDPAQLDRVSALAPPWLTAVAGMLVLAGLWSAWKFRPGRTSQTPPSVHADVRALAGGLVIFGVMLVSIGVLGPWPEPTVESLLLKLGAVGGACLALYGMRGIMATIGKRSREYRTSRGGRQRATEMIFAALAAGVGLLVQHVAFPYRETVPVYAVGMTLTWISMLMLVIGLAYMLVNAWWIRRALRTPPPRLAEIIGPAPASP